MALDKKSTTSKSSSQGGAVHSGQASSQKGITPKDQPREASHLGDRFADINNQGRNFSSHDDFETDDENDNVGNQREDWNRPKQGVRSTGAQNRDEKDARLFTGGFQDAEDGKILQDDQYGPGSVGGRWGSSAKRETPDETARKK